MPATFGPKLKALRLAKGVSRRDFCLRHGFDPVDYGKVESGLFAPPGHDVVKTYAEALEIHVGSDGYVQLLDAATADRAILPLNTLDDSAVLAQLPIFLRTADDTEPTPGQLDKLIDVLRTR